MSAIKELLSCGCSYYFKENKLIIKLFLQNKGGGIIRKVVSILRSLEESVYRLEVHLGGSVRSEEPDFSAVKQLLGVISKFHETEHLLLDISNNRISRLGAETVFHIFSNLRSLKELILDLSNSGLSDFDLKKIGDGIRLLRKLKKLTLNLNKNVLTGLGAKILGGNLQDMSQLEILELDISNNDFDNEAVWEIVNGMLHIHNLQKLVLACRACQVTDDYKRVIRDTLKGRVQQIKLLL